MVCEPVASDEPAEEDAHQLWRHAVSPRMRIAVADVQDAGVEWVAGRGLVVTPAGEHPEVVVPAPYALAEGRDTSLEIEIEPGGAEPLELAWIDQACRSFSPSCTVPLRASNGPVRRVVDLSGRLTGRATRIRLRLPAASTTTIRSLRVQEALAPSGGSGRSIPLLSAERSATLVIAHDLTATFQDGRGLQIRFAPANPAAVPDPFVGLVAGVGARDATHLVLRGDGLPEGDYQIFFTNEDCPHFSESCKAPAQLIAPDAVSAHTAAAPLWRGEIEALRIDFPPSSFGEATLRSIGFVTDEELASLRAGAEGQEAVAARAAGPEAFRSRDGWLAWRLSSGTRLVCRFGTESASRRETPQHVRFAIRPQDAALAFAGFHADWILEDGTRATALDYVDSLTAPRASGALRLPLRPPEGEVDRLEFRVTCSENCASLAEPPPRAVVARPLYRYEPAEDRDSPPPHVVLVSIDTLRADRLSIYGHSEPTDRFLAAWSEKADVFERVHSVDNWTVPTHVAMLTGRYPTAPPGASYGAVPDDAATLAEILASVGYRTVALTDGVFLEPERGFDRGFDFFESRFEPIERKVDQMESLLGDAASLQVPIFAFLHTYEVHDPYSLRPGLESDAALSGPAAGGFPVPADELRDKPPAEIRHPFQDAAATYVRALYDGSIQRVDRALERLFTDPRLSSVLDRAVIVVTSDHGEELLERGGVGHGRRLPYPELTHVPLLIKKPGQTRGTRIPEILSQVEIPRLILADLGLAERIEPDPCVQPGVAVVMPSENERRDYPHRENLIYAGVADGLYRVAVRRRASGETVFEWTEPSTGGGAPQSDDSRERRLADWVSCLERRSGNASPPPEPKDGLTKKTREQLRALGYVAD
jgi:hypothetical protein